MSLSAEAAVYVATGPGSFYDHQDFKFKDSPSDTDFVCTSINPPGPWTQGGRPCDFVLWPNIPATQSIATCDTSSGTCKNQNGGIEAYVLKSSIVGGSTPIPPVPIPAPTTTATEEVDWTAPTKNTDGSFANPTGYHVRWSGPQTGEATIGNILTYTIQGLANGSYFVTVATLDSTGEGAQSRAASFTINSNSNPQPPVPAPVPTPTPPPTPTPTVSVVEVLGTWNLMKGSTNVQKGFADYASCRAGAAAHATATSTKYSCVPVGGSITVKLQ